MNNFDDFFAFLNALKSGLTPYEQRLVDHTETDGYVIDTTDTDDCGFETAVWKENSDFPMVIVERYPDRETAKEGHSRWVTTCHDGHPEQVYSVQLECLCAL